MAIRYKILAVDDNEMNLDIMEEILSDDYIVKTAQTGEEAIETVAQFTPDIVLLDIMMPGMDGYQTCEKLREIPSLVDTKIIMVSAKATLPERMKGYEVGADDYLVKPFEEDELMAKVSVYLRLRTTEEISKMKDEFSMAVSHEMRTPLNAVIGFGEYLQESITEDENKELCKAIVKSGKTLLQIVEDILNLSQLEKGSTEISGDELVVDDFLGGFLQDLRDLAESKGLDFQIIKDADVPEAVYADAGRLEQCLVKLIDNAIKFTSEGHVHIKLSLTEKDETPCLRFNIEDTGIGIDEQKKEVVFESFSQADSSACRKYCGTGIGLAIARHLAERLSGTLEHKNNSGGGSVFSLTVPAAVERVNC